MEKRSQPDIRPPILKLVCPGCGRGIHHFHVPSKPGTYRVQCQANRAHRVEITIHEKGEPTGVRKKH